MKRKIIGYILLATLACVALFGFAACDNGSGYDDSALVDRIEALEDQIAQQGETIENQQDTIDKQDETIKNQAAAITALQNSVTELQTAKTNLEKQIASLEDDNTANKTEITALKTKVEALEAANAKFQQQIDALDTSSVTFAEDLAELTSNYNSLTDSVQNATHIERVVVTNGKLNEQSVVKNVLLTLTKTDNLAVIGCNIEYIDYPPLFQLVTCVTQITVNQQTSTAKISLTRADLDTSTKSITGSQITDILMPDGSTANKEWTEIIFYTFY